MVFLDKVTEVLPCLFAGDTALMDADKTRQFGLERVTLPGGAVQVDQGVADHQRLPWRVRHVTKLKELPLRSLGLLRATGIECREAQPRFHIVRKGHEVRLVGIHRFIEPTGNHQRLLFGILARVAFAAGGEQHTSQPTPGAMHGTKE